jgi:phosphatidylinositol kinase/protein kinase (PI-3  family)
MRSLAGYSLLCYVLNIKDRHNGNILVDRHGHLIHIDYGFMLANTPGSVGFEMAPFKLTQEYVDVLGGTHSEKFREFKTLLQEGLIALRTEIDRIITLVELVEKDWTLPCFTGRTPKPLPPGVPVPPPSISTGSVLPQLKERFHEGLLDKETVELVDRLVTASHNNIFTRLYDSFQYYAHGLLP